MDYTVHGILWARMLEWVAFPFSRGTSQPRDQTQVSRIAADSLPAEPPGKPKNTGVGSLPLLQGIFPTQELNQGLLHCRQILYQLSYQGSQWLSGKEATCRCRSAGEHRFDPWVGKIPWRRKWQPTPVFLPGESHGQKSYSLWSRKESEMTERLVMHVQYTFMSTNLKLNHCKMTKF